MAKLHQLVSLHGISMYLCYDCPVSLIKIRHKKSVKPIDWLGEVDWLKSECTVVSVFSIHCVWTWGIPWKFHAEYDHEFPQTRWKFGCAPFSNKPWFPCLTFRLTSECATQHASLWHPFFGQQQLQLNQWIRWCWLVVEPYPFKKRWSSSVGMIIPFPTEWKNNPHVPNHQPGCLCVLVVFLLGGLCRNIGDSPYRVDKYFRQGARGPQKNPSFMGQIGIAPIEDGDITI